jgi:hypothetical protein
MKINKFIILLIVFQLISCKKPIKTVIKSTLKIGVEEIYQKGVKEISSELFEETSDRVVRKSSKQIYEELIKNVSKGGLNKLLVKTKLNSASVQYITSKVNKYESSKLIMDLSKLNSDNKNLLNYLNADISNLKAYHLLLSKNNSSAIRSSPKIISQVKKSLIKGDAQVTIKLATRKNIKLTNAYGIKYIKKNTIIDNIKYVGEFPEFSGITKTTLRLPRNYYNKPRNTHFVYLNKMLKQKVISNPQFAKKFSKKEILNIKEGRGLKGYSWHHHESRGIMQLVPSKIHTEIKHTGGVALWCGGNLSKMNNL